MNKGLAFLFILIAFLLVSCSSLKDFTSKVATSETMTLPEKLEYFGGVPVSVDMPEIYVDGTDWLIRMTDLVKEAEDYILISTFLGSYTDSLSSLYDAIMEKAKEGVDVYFIMDGISSFDMTETKNFMTPLYFLRDNGVNLVEASPASGLRLMNLNSLLDRDHRKIMIIDGKYSAIGGMNLNYISLGAGEGNTQRDSFYVFESSSLTSALIDVFIKAWNQYSVQKIDKSMFQVDENRDGVYLAWLFNRGKNSKTSIAGMFGSLIGSAKESIVLLPYLPILEKEMTKSLNLAAERGVEIEMLVPVDTRGYAEEGLYYYFPKLVDSVDADIYLSIDDNESGEVLPLLHEKLMIVDGRYVMIGSTNFNLRSMEMNYEISLVIDSPELATIVTDHVQRIKETSSFLLTEELADSLYKEGASLLSYLFMYFGG